MSFSALPWELALALAALVLAGARAEALGMLDTQQAGSMEALLVAREFGGLLVGRQATNLQTFAGALGGILASPITNSGNSQRRFAVDGNTFTDFASAASRSCSDQHNSCANFSNSNKNAGFSVGDCDKQQSSCNAAAATATQTAFQVQVTSDANFDYFCDV